MRKLIHKLRFFVTDAWDEWRHSPGVNLLAVATLTSTLFLAGVLALVLSNVKHRVERLRQEVRIDVYLDDDLAASGRTALMSRLEGLDGVLRVDYVGKREAMRRYRSWASEMAVLIEELESNPLPASLEVYLQPGPAAEDAGTRIATLLAGQAGVEEVRFNRDWLRRLESLVDLAQVGGSAFGAVILAVLVFVMASVLRLAVYARRDEIDIMLLVGATPAFIRGPFLVAGLGQGLLAVGLALGLVELVRRLLLGYASGSFALVELLASRPMPLPLSLLLLLVGLGVSLSGAYFAVRPRTAISS